MLTWLSVVLAIVGAAQAHGWYERACCGDVDCHPTPCERIVAVAGGFEYRDAAARATYFFTRDKMRPSQDENCHVCVTHNDFAPGVAPAPLCVYLPVRM